MLAASRLAQLHHTEQPEKGEEREELSREPQVPPLKLAILVFMFLCKEPSSRLTVPCHEC